MYMTNKEATEVTVKIVRAIIKDFTHRRGLRQEWEFIDDEIQGEIISKWCDITLDCLVSGGYVLMEELVDFGDFVAKVKGEDV